MAEAGLAPLTFHELRHTAAALMINDGADPLAEVRAHFTAILWHFRVEPSAQAKKHFSRPTYRQCEQPITGMM